MIGKGRWMGPVHRDPQCGQRRAPCPGGASEVNGFVGFFADHPAVVPADSGERIPGAEHVFAAVGHADGGLPGDDHTDMAGPPDNVLAELAELQPAVGERAHLGAAEVGDGDFEVPHVSSWDRSPIAARASRTPVVMLVSLR
jgi:hypothetical protein